MEKHQALLHWMVSNHGYLHPDIELSFDPLKGFHARVLQEKTVEAGTCVAKSSMSTAMSVLNALDMPPFSCHGTKFPAIFLNDQPVVVIQCFFLMEQWLLGDRSWWAPYICTLPKPDEIDDLYYTDTDENLIALSGTGLVTAIQQQFSAWKSRYEAATNLLTRLGWSNAVDRRYSW